LCVLEFGDELRYVVLKNGGRPQTRRCDIYDVTFDR